MLALGSTAMATWAQDLPDGWRLPTRKELSYEERKNSATRFAKASADFNGDGVVDDAMLLKSTRYSAEALWVRLSTGEKGFVWLKLDETKWGAKYPNVDLAMGIEVAPPGVYSYGCFDDAKECNFEHPRPKLKLRDPSIDYFKFGSASSGFFWSYKYRRFLRVWISD